MAHNRKLAGDLKDDSYLEDELDESLLQSPVKRLPLRNAPSHNRQNSTTQNNKSDNAAQEQQEVRLRQELASVRKVNEAIEGVLESLEKAKSNMKNVNQTVGNAASLLNIWTRILSQTEHNQRLILDPTWQGASQDIADIDEEAQAKQQAAERREAEEQERRAVAARKAEEEERRRTEIASAPTKPKPGLRGRGGLTRGTSTSRAGSASAGGSANTSMSSTGRGTTAPRRTTSGLGRGTSTRGTRGTRGRGT